MRDDMDKVLVERPRAKPRKLVPRLDKGSRRALQRSLATGDSTTTRAGMKRRTNRFGYKEFNEHLGPLRRYLDANVGRPWDQVYSEICQHIDCGNVVQKHILTHLFEYVVTNAVLIDGQPCRGVARGLFRPYGEPLRTSTSECQWYVCPKSGHLKKSRYVPYKHKWPDKPRHVWLNKTTVCAFLDGRWQLIRVLSPQGLPSAEYGPVIRAVLSGDYCYRSDGQNEQLFAGHKYRVSRRVLSRREVRAMPIPAEWLR